MIAYKPLPKEVLVIIFQHLGFAKEIGECRLVCKAWSDPAERAMFRKPLMVFHEAKAEKVIRYLENNPAKGRCITSLTVGDCNDQRVMKRLLQLAFTPSIKRMDGKVLNIYSGPIRFSAIFPIMIEIAENSPIKFDRLTTIPVTFVLNDLYGRALLAFKETLEVVQIGMSNLDDTQDVLHRFGEFKNLKVLHLEEGELGSIQALDAVLKGCHHLKELYLGIKIMNQTDTQDLSVRSTTAFWRRMQVQKEPSLEKLTFVSPGYPLVIEYLLYKYPNLQDFRLDPMERVEAASMSELTSLNFERILENIKRLKKYSLNFTMHSEDGWSEKVRATKGDINSLTIQYPSQFIVDDEIYIRIDVDTLENKTRKAHFILEVPTIAADFDPFDLVREAGIPLERLELNFVDFAAVDGDQRFLEQLDRSDESAVFFDIMYDFPHIKEIKLTAHYLSEASDMFSTHDTIELRSLEICGAEVTQDALQCVSYECPQLKKLKLVNCFLAPEGCQNTFHIRMDRTSFDQFTYTTIMPIEDILRHKEERDAKNHFSLVTSKMQNSWTSFNIYVWLGIKEAGKKIYFIIPLVHSKKENLSVCQELFDLRPVKESPLLHFTCFNIKSLCFQVGSVSFTIKEDMIRECVESSVMSYPLEKGDINEDEEEE